MNVPKLDLIINFCLRITVVHVHSKELVFPHTLLFVDRLKDYLFLPFCFYTCLFTENEIYKTGNNTQSFVAHGDSKSHHFFHGPYILLVSFRMYPACDQVIAHDPETDQSSDRNHDKSKMEDSLES